MYDQKEALKEALREIDELKALLRAARTVIENPMNTVPNRRRVLEEIDKAL